MIDRDEAARRLLEIRHHARPLSVEDWKAEGIDIATEAESYSVQAAMERLLISGSGYRPIGYKIGATNRFAREMLGVDAPFFGRLFDAETTPAPGPVKLASRITRLLEPEVAIEIGENLRPGDAPFDADRIRAATAQALPAFELVGSCLVPWTGGGGPFAIADNGLHVGWYPGEAAPGWKDFDPLDGEIVVLVDGKEVARGNGRAVDGGAFGAAAWLANRLAKTGRSLKAGEFITTGTVVAPLVCEPGQQVVADFGALGKVAVDIED